MTEQDLMKFCDTDMQSSRSGISKPWSAGKWTYATNGHIIVRVPRIESVPENKDAPKGFTGCQSLEAAFGIRPRKWLDLPTVMPKMEPCESCLGEGKFKNTPCRGCNGTGQQQTHSRIDMGAADFSDVYLSWIAALPGSKIGPMKHDTFAVFKFDGGMGLLMPMRRY